MRWLQLTILIGWGQRDALTKQLLEVTDSSLVTSATICENFKACIFVLRWQGRRQEGQLCPLGQQHLLERLGHCVEDIKAGPGLLGRLR